MHTGIYKIKNLINNNFYVGSTQTSFKHRFSQHISDLNKNKHRNIHLQRACNKYGINNFSFEIIEKCSKEDCIKREQYYIDSLHPEYNLNPIAFSNKGLKWSLASRQKLSKAKRGQRAWNKGLPFSEEVRNKMSLARLGKSPHNKGKIGLIKRYVYCSNGKIYESVFEASKDLNVKQNTIVKACTDKKQIRKVKGLLVSYEKLS